MNRTKRSKQGFTLVELIVVIAILAILAGVAVPVYSGYIEKANEAADLQLLSAVNTAFGAACAGHGLDPTQVNATAQLDAEGHLVSVTPAALNEDFLRYYGENVGVPFKVYTSLGYDRANGRFVNGATEISVAYGDGVVTVTMEQITAYNASTFGDMGSSVVLDEVNHVVNAAKNAMGQLSDPSNPAYAPYRAGLEQFLQENYGVSLDGLTDIQRSNALVLMVAHNAKNFDAASLVEEYNSTGSMNSLLPELGDDNDMLGSLATGTTIPYALALAYVNSGMAADDIATGRYISHVYSSEEEAIAAAEAMGVDPSTIRGRNGQYRFSTPEVLSAYDVFYNGCTWGMNTTLSSGEHLSGSSIAGAINMSTFDDVCDITSIILASDGFKSYMQSGQGEQDLNAFFTAMTMLDNNASNIDVNDLLTNGFGDEGLQEMIALVLGN